MIAVVLGLTGAAIAEDNAAKSFAPEFYAFQNGVNFGSYESEAKTLKELGYTGINQVYAGGQKLADRIAAYEKIGLRVLSVYLNVDDKPISADVVKPFEGRGALIELTVRRMTPNTVKAVRETAEMAEKMKIRVALYPHHGFAVATMPQAMELIAKVDHANLGVMFNLCHFLKNENVDDLESVLEKAGPHLFAVSTSGANVGGKGWGDLIQTLDKGDFPQKRLFGALKKLKFAGPVGLQCYGVRGDKRNNLKYSIAAWNKILEEL
jgi:sugar phosphate isomerase/epimerase